jgi:arylsulfatase A-like enzyme
MEASSEAPTWSRALAVCFAAGVLGACVGAHAEVVALLALSEGRFDLGLLAPAALFYGLNGALYVTPLAFLVWQLRGRRADERTLFATASATTVGVIVGAIGLDRTSGHLLALASFTAWDAGAVVLWGIFGTSLAVLGRELLRRIDTSRFRSAWVALAALTVLIVGGRLLAAAVAMADSGDLEARRESSNTASSNTASEHPNVLLIVVDTLRADALPDWGADVATPNLARLAADSVRFEESYSPSSWTRPSFASLYSGRHSASHGVMLKSDALPDDVATLAESLASAGFQTGGIMGNYNAGPHFNFGQGFDDYRFVTPDVVLAGSLRVDAEALGRALGTDLVAMVELLPMRLYQRVFGSLGAGTGSVAPGTVYQDAEVLTDEALRWLEGRDGDRPFFLALGYMDPHHPFYRHPYDGFAFSRAAHELPSLSDAPLMRGLYDGEIEFWDAHFGRLLDALQERGLYEDTLIVLTSDHGEEFGEHGGFYHGTTVYDEVVHVPLYVKYPGSRRAGTTVGHPVQTTDLMPTILQELDLPIPEGVQGGLLDDGQEEVLIEEEHEGHVLSSLRAEIDGTRWSLILCNADNPRGLPPIALYDVDADPGQQRDLSEDRPEVLREMAARLERAAAAAAEGGQRQEIDLGVADRMRLCALGYGECD